MAMRAKHSSCTMDRLRLTQILTLIIILLLTIVNVVTSSVNDTSKQSGDSAKLDGAKHFEDDRSSLEKGMDALYTMTDIFLSDVIQPHNITEYFNISKWQLRDGNADIEWPTEWHNFAKYSVGFLVCIAIGVVFVLVMPLIGFIFCLCRCCGRCGGRASAYDHKRARCKKSTYGVFFAIVTTLILASAVCSFVTVALLHDRLQSDDPNRPVINKIRTNINDFNIYVNATLDELSDKTVGSFAEFYDDLMINKVNKTANELAVKLTKALNMDEAFNKARSLATDADAIVDTLDIVDKLTKFGDELNRELEDIKNKTLEVLERCSNCTATKTKVQSLHKEADFSQLDELSSISKKVDLNVTGYINEGEHELNQSIKSFQNGLPDMVTDSHKEMKKKLTEQIDDIFKQLKLTKEAETKKALDKHINPALDDASQYLDDYEKYWHYPFIALCCIVVIIIVCNYMGLVYGTCCERPGDHAYSCNKGVGANFLMAGVGFTFIFSWFLMLITLVMFGSGGVLYTESCRYLINHDPADLQDFHSLMYVNLSVEGIGLTQDQGADGQKHRLDFYVDTALQNCQEDKSLYESFNLRTLFNLDKEIDLKFLEDAVAQFKNQSQVDLKNLNFTQDIIEKISAFGNSGFETVNISSYRNQINSNITSVDLVELASELRETATSLRSDIAANLTTQINRLEELQNTVIANISQQVQLLNDSINKLDGKLDFKNKTNDLIATISATETKATSEADELLNHTMQNISDQILAETYKFKNDVVKDIEQNAGACKPLVNIIYSLTDILCKDLLNPYNGFWFSMGWSLFFLIPSIILAVKLSGLYRKEYHYQAGVRDSDDHHDLYGTPNDTIPLTSIDSKHDYRNGGLPNSAYRQEDTPPSYQVAGRYAPGGSGYGSRDNLNHGGGGASSSSGAGDFYYNPNQNGMIGGDRNGYGGQNRAGGQDRSAQHNYDDYRGGNIHGHKGH